MKKFKIMIEDKADIAKMLYTRAMFNDLKCCDIVRDYHDDEKHYQVLEVKVNSDDITSVIRNLSRGGYLLAREINKGKDIDIPEEHIVPAKDDFMNPPVEDDSTHSTRI